MAANAPLNFFLIDHGPEALPAVHSALISDDVTLRHAQVLLQVIRSIGDKSSVPVVLEFLKRDTNNPLRRDALLVLALLPAAPGLGPEDERRLHLDQHFVPLEHARFGVEG